MTTRHPKGLQGARVKRAPARPLTAPEAMRSAPSGKVWHVETGLGAVNIGDAHMLVPETDSSHDRHVRIHELLHARITPADLLERARAEGISWEALQGCEDARLGVTATNERIGSYTTTGPMETERAVAHLAPMLGIKPEQAQDSPADPRPPQPPDYHRAATLVMASTGTAMHRDCRRVVNAIPDPLMRRVVTNTIDLACVSLSEDPGPYGALKAAKIIDRLRALSTDEDLDDPGGTAKPGDDPGSDENNKADSTLVHIHRPPLTTRSRNRRNPRIRRTLDGGRLARPLETRNPTGGLPFDRKRNVPGGVVVIDVSGSMHTSHDDLQELVQGAPGALVLTYSAKRHGDKVVATIVGEKGRCVAPHNLPNGGGNLNDASVLQWAAENAPPGPRIWISDGETGDTTGNIDNASMLHAEITRRRLGYTRVMSVREALGKAAPK